MIISRVKRNSHRLAGYVETGKLMLVIFWDLYGRIWCDLR